MELIKELNEIINSQSNNKSKTIAEGVIPGIWSIRNCGLIYS